MTTSLRSAIRRAQLHRGLAWLAATLAAAWGSWRLAEQLGISSPLLAAAAVVVLAALAFRLFRSRPITTATLVEHLNRTVPELEESASLLLREPAELSALERLQQARAATAWQATSAPPRLPLPSIRVALGIAIAAVALGLVAPLAAHRTATTKSPANKNAAKVPLSIERVRLRWDPPNYTGNPGRTATTLESTIEFGSEIEWRVRAPSATAVQVVSAAGDTMRAVKNAEGEWSIREIAARGHVWHIEAVDAAGTVVRGEEHLLRILADREPVVAVLAPEGRVELEWREPHHVVVRAIARDDYGLSRIRLAATVAKGRGEGVKFKESWLPVDIESRTGSRELVASRRVNLDSLGVEPGDEVFLAFEATDNRSPGAQSARSESIFLSLLDTLGTGSAAFDGLAVRVEPAYFRSQRQIILDTEALLRDVREGRVKDGGFARAMEIGMDQHLLRLRYGGIVGEETNEEIVPDADFTDRHDHDMVDNATLLSPTVKGLLKAALAAMWDAERELRTGKPRPALPHEYRALASLEEVRRAERSYVKRIGFEPKPVDVNRTRLTKKADRLAPLTRNDVSASVENEPVLREALTALATGDLTAARGTLDAAARRLAERALDGEPARHLETLRALRQLIDGTCATCRDVARRGLMAALPEPPRPLHPRQQTRGALGGTRP